MSFRKRQPRPAERATHQALLMRGRVSAAELAVTLAMPPLTAYRGLCRLEEIGLARTTTRSDGAPGRPTVDFHPRLPSPVAAVAIDGSSLVAARIEPDLSVGELIREEAPAEAEGAIRGIARAVRRIAAEGPRQPALGMVAVAVNAVGLGGEIASSVLPWVDAAWRRNIGRASRLPVRLVFPPVAVAEFQRCNSGPGQSMVYFHAGDGVSAHGVHLGKLHTGASGMAGELGHVTLSRRPDAPRCGCGKRGCLEALCAGPGIVRRLAHHPARGDTNLNLKSLTSLPAPRALDVVWQAWLRRDPLARAVMSEALDDLAWGLSLPVGLIDPDWVRIGGYVFDGRPAWIEAVRARLSSYLLHADHRATVVEPARSDESDLLRVTACCASFEEAMVSQTLAPREAAA